MARKILLADDSVTAQNMGRKILADAGYEVLTVNNGSAALKKIAEMKPEIIVLDVYMPGYSGLEVCQRLKEAPETARIPVLLTVGKLEPFKPEEARRVRADGYIVKPFEASELLSALSKLEDKIVPRQEPSKPGRFARANAAIDEARYDKTAASEEDSGWKNRIAFPSKKKKAEDEPADDAAIYNAVNKDLRTRVDQKPAAAPENERVSLAALVPEGLPKDVTPEEIAALAAAAAQVQGKISEAQAKESRPQELHPEESHTEASYVGPVLVAEKPSEAVSHKSEVSEPVVAQSPAPAIEASASQPVVEKPEDKIAAAPEAVAEAPKSEPTLEEKRLEQKTLEDQKADAEPIPTPSAADVNAALATLEPSAPAASPFSSVTRDAAEEPAIATMAAAAGAQFAPAASRWTAVSVALAPEETALSLEHEMQKAYAAFAAADASPVPSAAIAEPVAVPSSAFLSAEPKPEAAPEIPSPAATAEPELSPAAGAVASAASEAITGTVREFEAVGSAYRTDHPTIQPPEAAAVAPISSPETQPAEITGQAETVLSAAHAISEGSFAATVPTESSVSHFAEAASTLHKSEDEEAKPKEPKEESKYEAASYDARANQQDQPAAVGSHEIPAPAATVAPEPESFTQPSPITASAINEEPAAPVYSGNDSQLVSSTHAAGPEASVAEPISAEYPVAPVAKSESESEMSATTAAAWASWRRIRESSDGTPTASDRDEAAMAVAAGAEKSPEDALAGLSGQDSAEDSGDISSIVDSVLADLRPKIVAEISRKLGKKK